MTAQLREEAAMLCSAMASEMQAHTGITPIGCERALFGELRDEVWRAAYEATWNVKADTHSWDHALWAEACSLLRNGEC